MLVRSRFADLASFVTVRALTDRTGLSNGAVYGAFRSGPASASGLTAPTAAARAALRETVRRTRHAVEDRRYAERLAASAGDPTRGMQELCSSAVHAWSHGDGADDQTLVLLAAAVAPRDDGLRSELSDHYERQLQQDCGLLDQALQAWGRRLRDGIGLAEATGVVLAVLEGLVLRARATGEVDGPLAELAGTVLLRGISAPVHGSVGLEDEELDGPPEPLSAEDDAAVAEAVRSCYDGGGWGSVRFDEVAAAAGIDVRVLRRAYPERELLARHVWERLVDATIRMAARVQQLDAREQATWLVHHVAEQVVGHRGAAMAMVRSDQRFGGPGEAQSARPPLSPVWELLARIVASDPDRFAAASSRSPVGATDRPTAVARFAVHSVVSLAMASPELGADEVADFVLDTALRAG
jgi:AcrR family transcriptional regulator